VKAIAEHGMNVTFARPEARALVEAEGRPEAGARAEVEALAPPRPGAYDWRPGARAGSYPSHCSTGRRG
jgi:hypothetical protein